VAHLVRGAARVLGISAVLASPTIAQQALPPPRWEHVRVDGARYTTIEGRPWAPGSAFRVVLALPRGYQARRYCATEVTMFVISGHVRVGDGTRASGGPEHRAGSYLRIPARRRIDIAAREKTIIVISGFGPCFP